MSFSSNIKNEISKYVCTKPEMISELSGIIRTNSFYSLDKISLITENASVSRRIYTLFKELYGIAIKVEAHKNNTFNKNSIYIIEVVEKVEFILKDLSVIGEDNTYLPKPLEYIIGEEEEIRSYLRGVFLAKGSINDPKTSRYHLEILVDWENEANNIADLLNSFSLNSKIINREKGYMVYIKEAEKISDFLRIISASIAVMYFEDIRIYRDHKNMTNRLNNCEQANIDKIIETANNQINYINKIKDIMGLDILDDKLKEASLYRLKYPDASLFELSNIITIETGNKITKPGLSHRFKKIEEFSNKLKESEK
ncbi:MAG: DNA-binding protein WhiA [Bacilli bacterium]